MKAIKLMTNGLTTVVELPERDYTYKSMQAEIGCDMVEIVDARKLGDKYCLVCDEEFLLKGQPVINPIASWLYGLQYHGEPLCGDVLIMKNEYTEEGLDTVGLDEDDIKYVHVVIGKNLFECISTTRDFLRKLNR